MTLLLDSVEHPCNLNCGIGDIYCCVISFKARVAQLSPIFATTVFWYLEFSINGKYNKTDLIKITTLFLNVEYLQLFIGKKLLAEIIISYN